MPAQIFGDHAIAVQFYLAFNGVAPSNSIYQNYLHTIGEVGRNGLALQIGAAWENTSDADLATRVLTNLGITLATTSQAAYDALHAAAVSAFASVPAATRAVVVMNLFGILSPLEGNATWGGVASTFNSNTQAAYNYASNAANTQTQTSVASITLPLSVNSGDIVNGTAGNDIIDAGLFSDTSSGTFLQVLQSGDFVNGGAGNDTMNLGLNAGGTVIPAALTSIETINATVTAYTILDMANATGLTSLNLANSVAPLRLTNNASVITNLGLSGAHATTFVGAGVTLGNTAASLAGTADALAISLSGQALNELVNVDVGAYESITITSNGSVTNVIALADSSLNILAFNGSTAVDIRGTGVTTNTLTRIDASAATGGVSVGASDSTLGIADQSVTGGSGDDAFFFGANYSLADTVNGGGGNDTISMTPARAEGVVANQTKLSNLEILNITNACPSATYTPGAFGGATTLSLDAPSAGAIIVNYLPGASGLDLSGLAFDAKQTFAITLNTPGVATTDTMTITVGSGWMGTLHTSAVTLNGTETLTIVSDSTTTSSLGALALIPTAAAESVVITGSGRFALGAVTADLIDASANTGGLIMVSGTVAAGGINITGTGAVDYLYGSANVDTINGGAGNDVIHLGAVADTSQSDVLTGGPGADTFMFKGTSLVTALTDSSQAIPGGPIVRITDFVAGNDKIGLVGSSLYSMTVAATQTIGSAATIAAVYAAITPIAASTTSNLWGVVGFTVTSASAAVIVVSTGAAAGTYLYINDTTAGVSSTADMLINITGVSGTISSADFVFSG